MLRALCHYLLLPWSGGLTDSEQDWQQRSATLTLLLQKSLHDFTTLSHQLIRTEHHQQHALELLHTGIAYCVGFTSCYRAASRSSVRRTGTIGSPIHNIRGPTGMCAGPITFLHCHRLDPTAHDIATRDHRGPTTLL